MIMALYANPFSLMYAYMYNPISLHIWLLGWCWCVRHGNPIFFFLLLLLLLPLFLLILLLRQSQVSWEVSWASPRPSFRSHKYDIFIGCCPGSPCAICIHKCRRWYTACVIKTLHLSKHSAYSHAPVGHYRHWGLRARRGIRRVCVCVCVFLDHSLTAKSCCVLYVLFTRGSAH